MKHVRLMGRGAVVIALATPLAQQPTFRSSASMVRLEVSVTDSRGPVRGLQTKDFEVVDDGVAQEVSVEEMADRPLDLVLVVQPIGSIAYTSNEQAARMRTGVASFISQVEDRDRLAVILAGAPPVRIRSLQAGKPVLGVGAFNGGVDAAPFDAITAAIGEFLPSDRRRALVAFVNGTDFRSTVSFEGLVEQTRRLGPAFVLLGSPVKVDQDVSVKAETSMGVSLGQVTAKVAGFVFPTTLQLLARNTGGLTVNLGSGNPIDVIAGVFTWLRTQYVVSYNPPAGKGWHTIKVNVTRKGVTVTTRQGYMVN